ncbi:MAG: NAD(P)H-hydrate dehydratase [Acidimicrobiales bacterium]
MIPIVTPQEVAAIDAAAPEPVEVLIERAGAATARAALGLLGGGYGRRVLVIAGKGNNGADGRAAARRLTRRGVRCVVIAPGEPPPRGACHLVIDAAYGTGFEARPGWAPLATPAAPVLAVDIPSGVSGLTGDAAPGVLAAQRTVTFAALKPGLVLHPGRGFAGLVEVADIGLDVSRARAHVVTAADAAAWIPARPVDTHKWRAAVWAFAGSPGMTGAAALAARAAQRAGAGYVRLSSPGAPEDPRAPIEAVGWALPAQGWAEAARRAGFERFAAALVGPGLGRSAQQDREVRELVATAPVPLVVDGDALSALGETAPDVLRGRPGPTVLTPHEGEFARLGGVLGGDRFEAVRALAARLGAVVLLKGPTTIVAAPGGEALVSQEGDARLATAGSGDVLTGIIAALLALGVEPARAAAAGAVVHGRAAALGPAAGLVAGQLPELAASVLAALASR